MSSSVNVKFLPHATTEANIQQLFGACGHVLEVQITDPTAVHAVVTYSSFDSASKAVAAFNHNFILGSHVEVSMGDQHGECKVFVGNLPSTVTQDELQRLFGPHGTVTEVVLLPPRASQSDQRCGFVKFSSYQEANSAIQAINGTDWNGSKMAVRMADAGRKQNVYSALQQILPAVYAATTAANHMYGHGQPMHGMQPVAALTSPGTKLFVGNIPSYWTKDNLAAQFGPYGVLEETVILSRKGINDTQCGFVKFFDPQCASLAMQSLAGTVIDGLEFVVRHADSKRQGEWQGGAMRTTRPLNQSWRPY
eukprot:EG_transcript_20527